MSPHTFAHRLVTGRVGSGWTGALDPIRSAMLRMKRRKGMEGQYDATTDARVIPALPRVGQPVAISVAVIGLGRMGTGIAGELLRRGCSVRLYDDVPDARANGRQRLLDQMQGFVTDSLLLAEDVPTLMARCSVHDVLDEALSNTQLICEAVVECLDAKRAVLQNVAAILATQQVNPTDVLVCTGTISISLEELTADLGAPWKARILGMRFFFPSWFVDDIELTTGGEATTLVQAERLLQSLHFRPVQYKGAQRYELTEEEFALYNSRQRQQCANDQRLIRLEGLEV